MTVTGPGEAPSLEDAARQLGLDQAALDPAFGVVLIDPRQNLYTVRVSADALPVDRPPDQHGPFSDPKIESFGSVHEEPRREEE